MNILIVDDHPLFRLGLRMALEARPDFCIVGEASTGAMAEEQVTALQPDLVLADVHLPDIQGVELAARLIRAHRGLKILMLSGDSDPALIQAALDVGACGYVLKETIVPILLHALDMTKLGKLFISPEVSAQMLEYFRGAKTKAASSDVEISDREREVLRRLSQGERNKEIAGHLGLSTKSVETYRSRLMKKLECSSPAELVRYALRTGIATL